MWSGHTHCMIGGLDKMIHSMWVRLLPMINNWRSRNGFQQVLEPWVSLKVTRKSLKSTKLTNWSHTYLYVYAHTTHTCLCEWCYWQLYKNRGPWNGFQRFLERVHYQKSLRKPMKSMKVDDKNSATDHKLLCNRQYHTVCFIQRRHTCIYRQLTRGTSCFPYASIHIHVHQVKTYVCNMYGLIHRHTTMYAYI